VVDEAHQWIAGRDLKGERELIKPYWYPYSRYNRT